MKWTDHRGQALVEWSLLLPLFGALLIALWGFGQWFVVREELIMTVREGALLYSSGRMTKSEVKQVMQAALLRGHPGIFIPLDKIDVGHAVGRWANTYRLDRIHVEYHPDLFPLSEFSHLMEEQCVIKHAPPYQTPFHSGQPVSW
jgi:hypothetical protein